MVVPGTSSYPGVTLRLAEEKDNELLFSIFCLTRSNLVDAMTDWNAAQRDALLRSQMLVQQQQYSAKYPNLELGIVVSDKKDIGLLSVSINEPIHLVDIALFPQHQGHGIGSALVQDLLVQGEKLNKSVTLNVEQSNPACHLYMRLGFVETGLIGIYKQMEWKPLHFSKLRD